MTVVKTLAGKYALGRVIGEGGMGAVFEAEHIEIGKRVAIKIVRELRGQEDEAAARFIREARAASAIDSDHIVQVFDVGQDPELGLYMVMELLAGEDLGSLLGRTIKLDAPLACGITDQAASALEKAHAAGVIHRDLKPENVFLKARDDGSATVKLVDFGIAKVVRDARSAATGKSQSITRTGSVLGSPCYMSPEQAQGLPDVGRTTDIYSLGAVLYEMLTGKRAFGEKPTYEQTIVPIITQTAPRVSATVKTVAPALDQLVADMMNPRADRRPATMTEVRRRLRLIQPGVDETRLRVGALGKGVREPGSRGPRTNVPVVTDQARAVPLTGPSRGMIAGGVLVLGAVAAFGALSVFVGKVPETSAPAPSVAIQAVTAINSPPPDVPKEAVTAAPTAAPQPAEPAPSAAPAEAPAASASTSSTSASAAPSTTPSTSVSARAKPVPGRMPIRPTDQVGGVGITTAF